MEQARRRIGPIPPPNHGPLMPMSAAGASDHARNTMIAGCLRTRAHGIRNGNRGMGCFPPPPWRRTTAAALRRHRRMTPSAWRRGWRSRIQPSRRLAQSGSASANAIRITASECHVTRSRAPSGAVDLRAERKHAAEIGGRVIERRRAEKHPADQHDEQHIDVCADARRALQQSARWPARVRATRNRPCHRPQTMKFQLAPCQAPLRKNTIQRLRAVSPACRGDCRRAGYRRSRETRPTA